MSGRPEQPVLGNRDVRAVTRPDAVDDEQQARNRDDLARELASISCEGLRRIGDKGRRDPDESGYLDPVFAQLELGISPGQLVLERWEGEWGRSPDRLIEYARY